MKARPSGNPGAVTLELTGPDESLMDAATRAARKSRFAIRRILVPIDFSNCSKKALQYALAFAKEHAAAVTLVYVLPPSYGGVESGIDYGQMEASMKAEGEKELARFAIDEVRGEVSTNTLVRIGSPWRQIVELATSLPADLIIISTHGRTGLKHVVLGSVAEHVVRAAPCPVLVVRECEHEMLGVD